MQLKQPKSCVLILAAVLAACTGTTDLTGDTAPDNSTTLQEPDDHRAEALSCEGEITISRSPVGVFCRTRDDECLNDEDCESLHGYCSYDALLGHWACSEYECCIG